MRGCVIWPVVTGLVDLDLTQAAWTLEARYEYIKE